MLNSLSGMKGTKEKKHKKDDSNVGQSHVDPIPFDLMVEILTRLPLESLLKFQYVSKTWCSIIRSKGFIRSLVPMSSTPSSQLLISFRNGKLTNKDAEKCLFFFTSSQKEDSSSSLVANLDMRMASMDAYFNTRCASVNGFICLSHKGRFMICNPSTRQVITLPEIVGTSWKGAYKLLGYDPVDDQYKAMCKRVSNFEEDQEHMVLTLGGVNKPSWRHIEGNARDYCPLTKGICIDGFVYYGAWTPIRYMDRVIVCFDVRSEKLSFIKLPPTSRRDIDWEGTSTLINYKGKLANVNVRLRDNSYGFDLLVFEDAEEHIWTTKSWSFPRSWWDSLGGVVPMSFQGTTKIGEIIITPKFLPRGLQPFYIIYFDEEDNSIRKVQLEGIADNEDFLRRYRIGKNGNCQVYISPEYSANFTFL